MSRNAKLTSLAVVFAVVIGAAFLKPRLSGKAGGGADQGGCGGGVETDVVDNDQPYEEYQPKPAALVGTAKIESIVAKYIEQKRTIPDDVRIARAAEPGWYAGKKVDGRILAGLTTAIDGRWVAEGREPGMDSGHYLCSKFEARVCSSKQLMDAIERGDFNGAPEGSVWFPRDEEFVYEGTTYKPHETAYCRAGLYPTGDYSWGSWIRVGTHLFEQGEATTKEASRTDLELKLGPSDPRFDETCLEKVDTCGAYIPSGYGCNERRSIPCCYSY